MCVCLCVLLCHSWTAGHVHLSLSFTARALHLHRIFPLTIHVDYRHIDFLFFSSSLLFFSPTSSYRSTALHHMTSPLALSRFNSLIFIFFIHCFPSLFSFASASHLHLHLYLHLDRRRTMKELCLLSAWGSAEGLSDGGPVEDWTKHSRYRSELISLTV